MRLRSRSSILISAAMPSLLHAMLDRAAPGARFRRAESRRELVEHAVDELVAVRSAVGLGEFHRLVDHDAVRHVGEMPELVSRDEQDRPLDRTQLRELAVQAWRER